MRRLAENRRGANLIHPHLRHREAPVERMDQAAPDWARTWLVSPHENLRFSDESAGEATQIQYYSSFTRMTTVKTCRLIFAIQDRWITKGVSFQLILNIIVFLCACGQIPRPPMPENSTPRTFQTDSIDARPNGRLVKSITGLTGKTYGCRRWGWLRRSDR